MASEEAILSGWDLMADSGLKSEPPRTARRVANWVVMFADWTDDQFRQASVSAGKSRTFFPTVGELRECLNGAIEVRATEAWELVREAIRKHGATATLTAEDLGGDGHALWCVARIGAHELGAMTDETRAFKAAEFRRLYVVATERGYRTEYLPGLFETHNRALGLSCSDPAMIGRPFGLPGAEIPALEAGQPPAIEGRSGGFVMAGHIRKALGEKTNLMDGGEPHEGEQG